MDLRNLSAQDPKIKYCCAKKAIALSKSNPIKLYPQFDAYRNLLDHEKNVLVWTGIIVLGNLSKVDTHNRIKNVIPKLIGLLNEKMMITAANSVKALITIAKYKPEYLETIIPALINNVGRATYYNKGVKSPECKNVVIGHLLKGLESLGPKAFKIKGVSNFVLQQETNSRLQVRTHANKLYLEHFTNGK